MGAVLIGVDPAKRSNTIEVIEGSVRPLARERRRSRSDMPARLQNARPVDPSTR